MNTQNTITQNTNMEDLVSDYPAVIPMLVRRGVVCLECGQPVWGTLGEALDRAGIHQVADRQILLAELQEMTRT